MMYPVLIEPDDNGTLLVTCPDLPEVVTFGEDDSAARRRAVDAIDEALAARMAHRDDIPIPSPRHGRPVVAVAPLTAAKVELYRAARAANVSDLAGRRGGGAGR